MTYFPSDWTYPLLPELGFELIFGVEYGKNVIGVACCCCCCWLRKKSQQASANSWKSQSIQPLQKQEMARMTDLPFIPYYMPLSLPLSESVIASNNWGQVAIYITIDQPIEVAACNRSLHNSFRVHWWLTGWRLAVCFVSEFVSWLVTSGNNRTQTAETRNIWKPSNPVFCCLRLIPPTQYQFVFWLGMQSIQPQPVSIDRGEDSTTPANHVAEEAGLPFTLPLISRLKSLHATKASITRLV